MASALPLERKSTTRKRRRGPEPEVNDEALIAWVGYYEPGIKQAACADSLAQVLRRYRPDLLPPTASPRIVYTVLNKEFGIPKVSATSSTRNVPIEKLRQYLHCVYNVFKDDIPHQDNFGEQHLPQKRRRTLAKYKTEGKKRNIIAEGEEDTDVEIIEENVVRENEKELSAKKKLQKRTKKTNETIDTLSSDNEQEDICPFIQTRNYIKKVKESISKGIETDLPTIKSNKKQTKKIKAPPSQLPTQSVEPEPQVTIESSPKAGPSTTRKLKTPLRSKNIQILSESSSGSDRIDEIDPRLQALLSQHIRETKTIILEKIVKILDVIQQGKTKRMLNMCIDMDKLFDEQFETQSNVNAQRMGDFGKHFCELLKTENQQVTERWRRAFVFLHNELKTKSRDMLKEDVRERHMFMILLRDEIDNM